MHHHIAPTDRKRRCFLLGLNCFDFLYSNLQFLLQFAEEYFRSKGLTEAGGARNEVSSAKSEIASKPSPSPKDWNSAISLQTGDASNPTPYWDIGVDGKGQYVQVVDTGFDDASCFLRDGPKRNLTGNLNDRLQVML